jgi:methylmalonyl-CoA/ethylmalonyl-CoA epimerase
MTTSVQLGPIGQIAVRVKDLDRSVAFYESSLGLPLLFRADPSLAFFACGQTRLMLTTPESPRFDHPSSVIYFNVPDIEAAHAELRDRGVGFLDAPHLIARMPDHELWMAFFEDPDANVLALMCEKR